MYLWKCWRDARSTFLIVVAAIVANSAFGFYVYFDPFGWIAAKAEWPRTLWYSTAQAFMLTMIGVTPIVGFVLGSLGVGSEFERRSADFLLTRPRSRRYFLWTSWALGAALVISLVGVTMLMIRIAPFRGNPLKGAPLKDASTLAGMCVVALAIYSVTYLMTTLTRSSRNGVGLAMLVFTAYTGIVVWLKLWYEISIPNVWNLVFSSGRSREIEAFGASPLSSLAPMLGWLSLCVALTFVAQYVFERQEA